MYSFLPVSQSKISSILLPPHACHIPNPFCDCSLLPQYLTSRVHYETPQNAAFPAHPLYSVPTLFPSLRSQTQPAYKWQKELPSLKSHFSCYSSNTSSYNPYFNKQNGLIKMQSNRSQITFHITYRLQYVSATRRHLHNSCFKQYTLPVQCTMTQDALYASLG